MNCAVVFVTALLAMSATACSTLNPFAGPSEPAKKAVQDRVEEPPKPKRQAESARLARFDSNADGSVVAAELEQGLADDFRREDANGDQGLDVAETRTLNERIRKEQESSPVFDWNADGRIVFAEFASQWRTLFQRSDINGDGIVDDEELQGKRREHKPRALPKPTFSGKDGRPPGTP